ncbi:MAG: IS3 family transposase, partial [Methylococcales bacterium]|nr:IS3 family transposase [Methylococcales bacterium]
MGALKKVRSHLGGKRGRLISSQKRQMAIQHIQEALDKGARQHKACEVAGISSRTLQRWRIIGVQDQRQAVGKAPANKLSTIEREQIIETCNREEYSSLPPKQIVPMLADKGIYLASESSFYRVLRDADQLHRRGRSTPANTANKPHAYEASMPNQIWSWDITYLASEIKGMFFYLYLFMDIYSRKIISWEVYKNESAEQAAEVLRKARMAEVILVNQKLVLHSDNGGPMKGATMLATLQKLGVVPSFSRPSVSNDNPYSESLFKTLKYTPAYPTKPFASLDEARKWVMKFVTWYNHSHR